MDDYQKEHWASRIFGRLFTEVFVLVTKVYRIFDKPDWDRKENGDKNDG